MLTVGLIGAGRIGRVHASTIVQDEGSQLVAVADSVDENAKNLAKIYKVNPRSVDAIFEDNSIEAILIASSTDTHSDFIEKASIAGKAILCEKPVDLSLARAKRCLENTKSNEHSIMMGFNRRFDPNFVALKNALDGGEIGTAELLSITSFDPAPPPIDYVKVSGGIFKDMMIHDFDMANFLYGELPKSIFVSASAIVDKKIGALGDYDTAVATLKYTDGRLAVIKNSRRATYGYDQRIEVLGSKGLLQVQNMVENCIVKSTEMGVESSKPEYFFLERYKSAYQNEWAAFVTAVKTKTPMPVSLSDGIAALAIAEAAAASAEMGSEVEIANFL
ncbi:MAG: inositol 2-dehydrogenase [Paracoccaceae bacterium]